MALRQPHPLTSQSPANPTLLQHIFWIWTIKEAFTKCLGLGLGFDFGRISIDLKSLPIQREISAEELENLDVDAVIMQVDGSPLRGYEFTLFEILLPTLGGDEAYQGVIARRLFPTVQSEIPSGENDARLDTYVDGKAGSRLPSRFILRPRIMFTPEDKCADKCADMVRLGAAKGNAGLCAWDANALVENAELWGDNI